MPAKKTIRKSRRKPLEAPSRTKTSGQVAVRWGNERIARMEAMALRLTARPPFKEVTLSDIARHSVDEYLDRMEATLALEKPRKPCAIAKVGEDRFCATCSYTWTGDLKKCPLED